MGGGLELLRWAVTMADLYQTTHVISFRCAKEEAIEDLNTSARHLGKGEQLVRLKMFIWQDLYRLQC
jgi:hypothetical protein